MKRIHMCFSFKYIVARVVVLLCSFKLTIFMIMDFDTLLGILGLTPDLLHINAHMKVLLMPRICCAKGNTGLKLLS